MKTNAVEKIIAGLLILGSAIILTLSTGASLSSMEYQQGASLQFEFPGFSMNPQMNTAKQDPAVRVNPSESSWKEQQVASTVKTDEKKSLPASIADPLGSEHRAGGDTISGNKSIGMDVKDNIVTREFINKNGEKLSMKFVIRKGEVKELYVNGEEVPKSEFTNYEKEIDRTVSDLREMDRDLRNARNEIAEMDWEELQRAVEAEMEHFRQYDMQKLQEEMMLLQKERIETQIDQHRMQEEIARAMEQNRINQAEMQEEMKRAMEEARKTMEEYQAGKYALSEEQFREMERAMASAMEQAEVMDEDKMREMFEKELQAVQDIDFEKIQSDIEKAMKEIDLAEIEKTIQESMKHLEHERLYFNKEVEHIDEMIKELEKLELKDD